jgi:hypothetical protein
MHKIVIAVLLVSTSVFSMVCPSYIHLELETNLEARLELSHQTTVKCAYKGLDKEGSLVFGSRRGTQHRGRLYVHHHDQKLVSVTPVEFSFGKLVPRTVIHSRKGVTQLLSKVFDSDGNYLRSLETFSLESL